MTAVEFKSTIREDGVIVVPERYKYKFGNRVRVILLSASQTEDEIDDIDFSAIRIKTKEFKFDREYANER
ncbi:MAG: hypothetical protein FWC32_05520 [Firmicutes bacterium]|nr:hypothetical protein [Bacillota bacterium]